MCRYGRLCVPTYSRPRVGCGHLGHSLTLAIYVPLGWECRPAWFGARCDRRVIDAYCQAAIGAFRRIGRR